MFTTSASRSVVNVSGTLYVFCVRQNEHARWIDLKVGWKFVHQYLCSSRGQFHWTYLKVQSQKQCVWITRPQHSITEQSSFSSRSVQMWQMKVFILKVLMIFRMLHSCWMYFFFRLWTNFICETSPKWICKLKMRKSKWWCNIANKMIFQYVFFWIFNAKLYKLYQLLFLYVNLCEFCCRVARCYAHPNAGWQQKTRKTPKFWMSMCLCTIFFSLFIVCAVVARVISSYIPYIPHADTYIMITVYEHCHCLCMTKNKKSENIVGRQKLSSSWYDLYTFENQKTQKTYYNIILLASVLLFAT